MTTGIGDTSGATNAAPHEQTGPIGLGANGVDDTAEMAGLAPIGATEDHETDESETAWDGDAEDSEPDNPLIAEAQKYRRRAQQAESRLEEVEGRLTAAMQREATQHLDEYLENGRDFFDMGGDLEDMLDADGAIDQDMTQWLASLAIEGRPYLARRRVTPDPDQGKKDSGAPEVTWKDLLRGH